MFGPAAGRPPPPASKVVMSHLLYLRVTRASATNVVKLMWRSKCYGVSFGGGRGRQPHSSVSSILKRRVIQISEHDRALHNAAPAQRIQLALVGLGLGLGLGFGVWGLRFFFCLFVVFLFCVCLFVRSFVFCLFVFVCVRVSVCFVLATI